MSEKQLCENIFFFFFFQAEDGIRNLVRSRGLGDVYKGPHLREPGLENYEKRLEKEPKPRFNDERCRNTLIAAPYTHLTLPTNYPV